MACNHKFQGNKDGVRCLLCGLSMNPEEYREYLNPIKPEPPEEPEKGQGAVIEPGSPAEKPQTDPDGAPKSAPKKTRASRKKREATADE